MSNLKDSLGTEWQTMLGFRFNNIEIMRIVERILDGESVRDIANEKGVYPHTIAGEIFFDNECKKRIKIAMNEIQEDIRNEISEEKIISKINIFKQIEEIHKIYKEKIEVINIVNQLNSGKNVNSIAKEHFVSKDAIYKKISKVGYGYINELKIWGHKENLIVIDNNENIKLLKLSRDLHILSKKMNVLGNFEMKEISIEYVIYEKFRKLINELSLSEVDIEVLIKLALLKFLDENNSNEITNSLEEVKTL